MMFSKLISVSSLAAAAFAFVPHGHHQQTYGCGEVDIVFTGLPGHHPLVTAQGFNGTAVQEGLNKDAADMLAAGYNVKVILMGPEEPMSVFANQTVGHHWDGVGLGYGVRGSHIANLTVRAEDILNFYRKIAPGAPILFDRSYTTGLWTLQRHFPLESDCSDSPGKNLGFNIICDICN